MTISCVLCNPLCSRWWRTGDLSWTWLTWSPASTGSMPASLTRSCIQIQPVSQDIFSGLFDVKGRTQCLGGELCWAQKLLGTGEIKEMNLSFEYYNSELWGSVGVGQYETKTHRDAPGFKHFLDLKRTWNTWTIEHAQDNLKSPYWYSTIFVLGAGVKRNLDT